MELRVAEAVLAAGQTFPGAATNFSGSLSGDVTGTQSNTVVGKLNGGSIPASAALVGTNSGGQLIAVANGAYLNTTNTYSATQTINATGTALNATGTDYGVSGGSTSGKGVFGRTNTGAGVFGYAATTTGLNYGVYGRTNSSSGYGVYGLSSDPAGTAGGFASTGGKILSGLNVGTEKFSVDGSGNITSAGAVLTSVPNNSSKGGTANNYLAELTGGVADRAVLGSGMSVLGIVVSGGGTTGSAQIAVAGQASCVFDGPTVAGDYVQTSNRPPDGQRTDAGATYPSTGQVLGRVLSTNTAASGTYPVFLFGAEQQASVANFNGSLAGDVTGTQSTTTVVKVNGAAVPASAGLIGTNSSGQLVAQTVLTGDGSAVTNLNAGNISTGTLPDAALSGSYTHVASVTAANYGTAVTATSAAMNGTAIQGTGGGWGVIGPSVGTGAGIGVLGQGPAYGVNGISSANGGGSSGLLGTGIGVYGSATGASGYTAGVFGSAYSPNGTGVYGSVSAASTSGIAGVFNNNAGGKILSGQNNGTEKFSVDGSGNVSTSGRINIGVYVKSCSPNAAPYDCACTTGDIAIGGGFAYQGGGNVLRESIPTPGNPNAWRVTCAVVNAANSSFDNACQGAYTVCLSHAQ